MQMSVIVDFVRDELEIDVERVDGPVSAEAGEISGNARFGYALSHASNTSIKAINRLLKDGEIVYWSNELFRVGGTTFDAGTFVIESTGEQTIKHVEILATELGLDFVGLRSKPSDNLSALKLPRVGLYKSYVAFMDEGWTRWLLEDYSFDLVSLSDQSIRSDDLSSLDAIIIPQPDGRVFFKNNVDKILTGHPIGTMPDEYVGGLGLEGAYALQRFAQDGGTIVTFGDASNFAISQFGLPIRNIVAKASTKDFSIPGSLIRATVNTTDPLAYGMTDEIAVAFVRGAAFDVLGQAGCVDDLLNQRHCKEIARGGRPLTEEPLAVLFNSVVNFAAEDLLMSGWATGTEYIARKSAMARVPYGAGQVILFGFRPQFRGQPRGTYKLVFNALYAATIK